MTEIIGFQKWKRKEKYIYILLWIHFIQGLTCTYIHPCTQCVVCAVTVWPCNLIPKNPAPPSPLPSHHTEIHGPQRQDVQKLVFNIKQCRPYRKQLSPSHPFFTPPLQGLSLYEGWAEPTSTKWQENQTQGTGGGRKHTYRIQQLPLHHSHFFLFLNTLIHAKFNQSTERTVKNSFREKKHDWTLDSWFLCCRLVTRETKVWEVEEEK